MKITSILISLLCAGVFLFCVYGFLATFEPLDASTQITFRIIYGFIGFIALVSGFLSVRSFFRPAHPSTD
jgi:hypothetical protein